MTTNFVSYRVYTESVFNSKIKSAIDDINIKATNAGFNLNKCNLQYIISDTPDNWVVVLLLFGGDSINPSSFIVEANKNS